MQKLIDILILNASSCTLFHAFYQPMYIMGAGLGFVN
jgi:hypothetical protein